MSISGSMIPSLPRHHNQSISDQLSLGAKSAAIVCSSANDGMMLTSSQIKYPTRLCRTTISGSVKTNRLVSMIPFLPRRDNRIPLTVKSAALCSPAKDVFESLQLALAVLAPMPRRTKRRGRRRPQPPPMDDDGDEDDDDYFGTEFSNVGGGGRGDGGGGGRGDYGGGDGGSDDDGGWSRVLMCIMLAVCFHFGFKRVVTVIGGGEERVVEWQTGEESHGHSGKGDQIQTT